jgi:prevent-host-death family protein
MTLQLNIADAKAKLSELVARAEAGEEVVLARAGKPIVTLTPVASEGKRKRTPGAWAHLGKLGDPDLFLRPDPELGLDADGPIFPTPGGFHEP